MKTSPENFKEQATLVFVIRDGEVLLIFKKRGIGKNQWNGPGGRIDEGETPIMAALREFKEETRAEADDVSEAGVLDFYIPTENFSMRVFVFRANIIRGETQDTEEATPKWFDVKDLPWGQMWMDDRIWLPHVIAGRTVRGTFVMENGFITKCELRWAWGNTSGFGGGD